MPSSRNARERFRAVFVISCSIPIRGASSTHSLKQKKTAAEAAAEFREETSKKAAAGQPPVAALCILLVLCADGKQMLRCDTAS